MVDCFEQRRPVAVEDLEAMRTAWPEFVATATSHGYTSLVSLPLRLRGTALGTLTLFATSTQPVNDIDQAVAQAFADVAAISLLQHRAASEQQLVNDQLQHALDSRVVIEQAKGVLAERERVSLNDAFDRLRQQSRSHNLRMVEVAKQVVDGRAPLPNSAAN